MNQSILEAAKNILLGEARLEDAESIEDLAYEIEDKWKVKVSDVYPGRNSYAFDIHIDKKDPKFNKIYKYAIKKHSSLSVSYKGPYQTFNFD